MDITAKASKTLVRSSNSRAFNCSHAQGFLFSKPLIAKPQDSCWPKGSNG
jgi:EAL domain-containing protein (putative c-di-GMP-specific phosphodiesterase class I)